MANIFDGMKAADEIKRILKEKVTLQSNQRARVPHLAIILAGDNPGSIYFVREIIEGGSEIGIRITYAKFPAEPQMTELSHLLDNLQNPNGHIDGIYVQLPVPGNLDEAQILNKIPWVKDVGDLRLGITQTSTESATKVCISSAPAILKILELSHWDPAGKRVLIVGESNLVKPLSMCLLDKKAIITIAGNYDDIAEQCKSADLIVSAVGKPKVLKADMVKEGAVVIDSGFSLDEQGKPCGDVDIEEVAKVTSLVTPIPGGVDTIYIALMLQNTWDSYLRRNQ